MMEFGYRVPPLSMAAIARRAESFLGVHAPEHLSSGETLDLGQLVDFGLAKERVAVCPVSDTELPDSEAETRAAHGGWLEILMREVFFDALFEANSNTVRARSTLAHEIGHAVLHRAAVMAGRHSPQVLTMRRALRSELKAYEDSEWQTHAFAGVLLIPLPALRQYKHGDIAGIAEAFDVSEAFARSHIRRVRKLL
jgi:hypothetical protein